MKQPVSAPFSNAYSDLYNQSSQGPRLKAYVDQWGRLAYRYEGFSPAPVGMDWTHASGNEETPGGTTTPPTTTPPVTNPNPQAKGFIPQDLRRDTDGKGNMAVQQDRDEDAIGRGAVTSWGDFKDAVKTGFAAAGAFTDPVGFAGGQAYAAARGKPNMLDRLTASYGNYNRTAKQALADAFAAERKLDKFAPSGLIMNRAVQRLQKMGIKATSAATSTTAAATSNMPKIVGNYPITPVTGMALPGDTSPVGWSSSYLESRSMPADMLAETTGALVPNSVSTTSTVNLTNPIKLAAVNAVAAKTGASYGGGYSGGKGGSGNDTGFDKVDKSTKHIGAGGVRLSDGTVIREGSGVSRGGSSSSGGSKGSSGGSSGGSSSGGSRGNATGTKGGNNSNREK